MFKKLKMIYRKYWPKNINSEGLYYDSENGDYVALYYSPYTNLESEIGRFDSLNEAEIAYLYYNKAVSDVKRDFKSNIKSEVYKLVDELLKDKNKLEQ